ncbi:helix-turn-helix transcriptional regulator [Thalassovita mangrovi]|uniref:HTH luxR-type domain-containing protein n=1 Tax=Thalassovita mangrovi TaxID=2692236 RepID=A0A6L8LMB9_9RHOB|nr:helix-turn-helix transcriptional regulator [Thalassovita mangrovi]MYM55690.1 hypothetical protein [Thalassovita mangrovi]
MPLAVLNDALELIYRSVDDDAALSRLAPRLGRMIGADAGDIVTERPQDDLIVTHSSFGFDPAFLENYDSDFLGENTWFGALRRLPADRFHTVEDRAPVLRDTRYFNEWVRPQHFDQSLGAVLDCARGQYTWIGFVRESGSPGFGSEERFLTDLLPHLRRMMRLRRRLFQTDEERMEAYAVLDRLHLPVFLLQQDFRVSAMNDAAESLQADDCFVHLSRDGRLTIEGARNDILMRKLRRAARTDGESADTPFESMVIHGKGGQLAVMHFIPLPQPGTGGAAGHIAAVVRPVDCPKTDVACLLAQAYDLTDTEARLANFIGSGAALCDFAAAAGMAPSTARWHLKNIEQKTGTSRIEQVVALVRNFQSLPA